MLGVQRCHHDSRSHWPDHTVERRSAHGHSGVTGANCASYASGAARLGLATLRSGEANASRSPGSAPGAAASAARRRGSRAATAAGVPRSRTGDRHRHPAFSDIGCAGVHSSTPGSAIHSAGSAIHSASSPIRSSGFRARACVPVHASHADARGFGAVTTAVRTIQPSEPADAFASTGNANRSHSGDGRWRGSSST